MRTSASGTIYAGTTVNITDEPHPVDRPLALWLVRPVPGTPNFEAVPHAFDGDQRDWFPLERRMRFAFTEVPGVVRLLATSRVHALALVPAGLLDLGDADDGGEWIGSPELLGTARAGAQPRAQLPSMPIKTLGSAA